MRMAEPHENGGAGRRGFVLTGQLLAGLDEAEAFGRLDAQGFQHLGREHLAYAALQRQPAVGAARIGRAAAALRREVEQAPVERVLELREQEPATVAEL